MRVHQNTSVFVKLPVTGHNTTDEYRFYFGQFVTSIKQYKLWVQARIANYLEIKLHVYQYEMIIYR